MTAITVTSTSRHTGVADDIVLRVNSATRLVFRPTLVNNPKNPSASVKGSLVFQRKSPKQHWEDIASEPLSKVKLGEAVKLEFHSDELRKLIDGVQPLYEIHESVGIPRGQVSFVPVRSALASLATSTIRQVDEILAQHGDDGASALQTLLSWASRTGRLASVAQHFSELDDEALQHLGAASRLVELRRTRDDFRKNRANKNENFWQNFLAAHSYILEQVFRHPVMVIQERAYVGGKSVTNQGGNIVDFLLRNRVSDNAALVEIKTPATSLLASEYRSGVYGPSRDLAGGVTQVLTYKESLGKEFNAISRSAGVSFDAFDPECVVIVGHAKNELKGEARRRSFELYRRSLHNVRIVTFDELYQRLDSLITMLSG